MKKKIAIIHPELKLGGSELVAVWLVEVLKKDYDVSLITTGSVDLSQLNHYYGTDIKDGEVRVISLPIPWLFKKRFDALRGYSLARFCKKEARQFDLMISTYNPMDFGKKGIQCIADLSFDDQLRRIYDPEPQKSNRWFYKKSFLRTGYLAFSHMLSGASKEGFKKNITISNSYWTQRIIKQAWDMESKVIYPPLTGNFPQVDWNQKQTDFVCLGRVSPEKQIEKIIGIIAKVREGRPEIKLHIIGVADDDAYGKKIRDLCEKNKSWCFFRGPMYGQEKLDFLAKHKYGISARANEPFGIAVGEMVKSGCIVFVPSGGGQVEIVNNSDLIYDSEEDGAEKIRIMLDNQQKQAEAKEGLWENSKKFSVEVFEKSVKTIIRPLAK